MEIEEGEAKGWRFKRDFDSPIMAVSGPKSHTHFTI